MAYYDAGYRESRELGPVMSWTPPDDGSIFPEDKSPGYFSLEHQCSDWKIGDIEDAKAFIVDLAALIAEVEANL